MRFRFPFLHLLIFFFVALVMLPTKTAEAWQLCYCRLTNLANLTESDERKFCRNEVVVADSVGENLTSSADCSRICLEDGNEYVGLSGSGPEARPYDISLAETAHCLFSKNSHSENDASQIITGWTENYNNCRSPLNSIPSTSNRNGALPSACSYCFCKYKSNVSPAACAGKTVYMHATGAPSECPRFCEGMGMDSLGHAVQDYNAVCDYKSSDNCGVAKNPTGKCGELLADVANDMASTRFQANKGSALGQLLPLGDISVPGVIARIIRRLLSVVGAIALVFFIWGGVKYMTAAGDEKKVKEARDMLVTTVSGLVAIFVSYALLSLLINVLS